MFVSRLKLLDTIKDENEDNKKLLDSVKSNYLDKEIYESALNDINYEKIKNNIDTNSKDTPFFNQLSKDFFNAMYKISPEVYDESNVQKSLKLENKLLKELIVNEEFNNLRKYTCCDTFNTMHSLNTFQNKAVKVIKEWIDKSKENKEMMDNINDAIQKQNELKDILEQIENGENVNNPQDLIDNLQNEISKLNDSISNSPSSPTDEISNSLGNILNDTLKEVEENENALDNLGLSNKGGKSNGNNDLSKGMTYQDKKRLIDALKKSSVLKDIVNKLGKMREMVDKISEKPSKYGQSICDIGVGNNINKSLSTEKMKLLDNELEYDFYKKLLNKSLLEYKTRGVEKGKGPIIVCIDVSGSMQGSNEVWAKSVVIASLEIAVSQKRNFRCIAFSDFVSSTIDMNKNDKLIDKILEISDIYVSGGTDYSPALENCLEIIEESKFKKADILFITDGEPYRYLDSEFKSKFITLKKSKDFKVQSILLGGGNTDYLEEFSDSITELKDLNKDNELVNIFNNIKE